MSAIVDFQLTLAGLLGRKPEEITEAVASAIHWYVWAPRLERLMGTSKPGVVKYDRWWWRIEEDGRVQDDDAPNRYIRKLTFIGLNKPRVRRISRSTQ